MINNKPIYLSKKPYDSSMGENLSMYDHFPYERDPDICNKHTVKLFSGNVIKFFTYHVNDDTITIPNKDDVMEEQLAALQKNNALKEEIETLNNTSVEESPDESTADTESSIEQPANEDENKTM